MRQRSSSRSEEGLADNVSEVAEPAQTSPFPGSAFFARSLPVACPSYIRPVGSEVAAGGRSQQLGCYLMPLRDLFDRPYLMGKGISQWLNAGTLGSIRAVRCPSAGLARSACVLQRLEGSDFLGAF
jgi:hypothetical protein